MKEKSFLWLKDGSAALSCFCCPASISEMLLLVRDLMHLGPLLHADAHLCPMIDASSKHR